MIPRSSLALSAVLMGVVALGLAALFDFRPSAIVALLAITALSVVPLARCLASGSSACARYQRQHRPLAGPKPGARLG